MDDIMDKLGELLSDEESVRQLSELAQLMRSDLNEKTDEEKSDEDGSEIPDIGKIMKFSGLLRSACDNDRNTEFLLALRPLLKEERRERVDKAVKLMKILAVFNAAKENGLLNDII